MSFQDVWQALTEAWSYMPIPVLFLYVIALGLLWLYIECMVSRMARAIPGWNRPVPLLPIVSAATAWLVRGSSWALWIWAATLFALAGSLLLVSISGPSQITDVVATIVAFWQKGYGILVQSIPTVVTSSLPGFATRL